MSSFPLLSLLTFLPLVGALLILFFVPRDDGNKQAVNVARQIALWTTAINFVVSLAIFHVYDPHQAGFQLVERFAWMPEFHLEYFRGIDGISIWLVLMTTFLAPICILSGFSVKRRVKELMIALLVLETLMVGMFSTLDFVLFYVFFEGVLIPMFLLIGGWGGPGRIYAAYKFFLYTFLGSVLMLIAILTMVNYLGTADMTQMMGGKFPRSMAMWLWVAFFASFAVKLPMWPFHTWLPYAHVEAPTAGSVLLAAILLKMGEYGFMRVSVQMLPEASAYFAPMVLWLSVIVIIYTSLVALVQTDVKKLIAYSSVAHMGYVTLGIFSFTQQGFDGAMMVMISHSIVSAGLFLGVGVMYDRLHTREITRFGRLAVYMPNFAALFMVFTLGAIGVPGTSGFVGEFLALMGGYQARSVYAFIGAIGSILGAAYMLWLYKRLFYKEPTNPEVATVSDMKPREYVMLLPLAALVLWMGVHPATFRDYFSATVTQALSDFQAQKGGRP